MQNNPGASQNNQAASDSTTIFRMPSTDATVPDLMGAQRLANPTLSIVKGPHTGTTFVLTLLRSPSAATPPTPCSSTT